MVKHSNASFWNDPKKRAIFFQALLLLAVGAFATLLIINTQSNLAKQNIASGFGFLTQEAGFEISESMIDYWADDTYKLALWVGILNTLKVALIGNVLAIILGVFLGIMRLSSHWLLSKLSQVFIEVMRNTPLLLQLFFWYAILTEIFPSVKEAYEPLPNVFLSQRGLVFPVFAEHIAWPWVKASFFIGIAGCLGLHFWNKRRKMRTGIAYKLGPIMGGVFVLIPLVTWLLLGAPTVVDWPELGGFNFNGGMTITPEFVALVLGLVLYTAAFNAEIVRAGIQSVSKGQWEAARSLGLSQPQALRFVILPQSLRVIIPPMTSQILNLIKNSSLAVGIGYPDFVSVANTTMNQTGQAIEAVVLIMLVYLFFSLSTSLFMNFYNKKTQLITRGGN
jgi:general L-amino acid transport system permease protein